MSNQNGTQPEDIEEHNLKNVVYSSGVIEMSWVGRFVQSMNSLLYVS